MLKTQFQIAIIAALVALIAKLIILYLGVQHDSIPYITFAYMLILLVTIFFGIRAGKISSKKTTGFVEDFKAGARTASYFALIVGLITYTYYSKIDTEFFPTKKAIMLAQFKEQAPAIIAEKGIEEGKKFLKENIEGLDVIYSPYSQTTYTLFGLVFLGLIHSAMFALLMKKFVGFKK